MLDHFCQIEPWSLNFMLYLLLTKKKQYTHRQPSILDHLGPILVMLGKMELYHILTRMAL